MNFIDILSALFLVGLLVLLFPRARQMITHSPPAQSGDWQAVLLPLVAVAGFVLLLMKLV